MLWYFSHNNTYTYIDVLQDFLMTYSSSKHWSIGVMPNQMNYDNETQVYMKLFGYWYLNIASHIKYKSNLQIQVHISQGGYRANWMKKIFTIAKQVPHPPPMYYMKDYQDVAIEGTFYEAKLQKVSHLGSIILLACFFF